MTSLRAALALGTTLIAVDLTAAAPACAQSDADRAAARTVATACLHAFNDGRFQEAVDLCTRAEALMHAPTHLLLLARAQTKLGHLVEAQEAYFRIKRDTLAPNAPKAFVEAQSSAGEEQAALAPRIPTIKITLDGAPAKDVALTFDGQSESAAVLGLPKPVDPGQHTLSAHGSNAESETVTINVPEGAAQNVTLTMHASSVGAVEPAPAVAGAAGQDGADHGPTESDGHGGLRVAGWVGLGLGVVGAALGTFFVLQNHSNLDDANALCSGSGGACPMSKKSQIDDYDSKASTASTLAWVSYGVGVAAAGAGVVMLVMSGGKSTPAPQAAGLGHARPWVGPGSAGVTVGF